MDTTTSAQWTDLAAEAQRAGLPIDGDRIVLTPFEDEFSVFIVRRDDGTALLMDGESATSRPLFAAESIDDLLVAYGLED